MRAPRGPMPSSQARECLRDCLDCAAPAIRLRARILKRDVRASRRHARDRARRRRRRAALSANQRSGQAGRLLRRPLPDHRLRAQQLHQLRAAPDLHRHAVQVALAQPPRPHGLEHRLGGARRVHRDPAAAEARRRALVPGHGRRRLPEPLLDHAREPAARHHPVGRPRLQDGLRADAPLPPGAERRGDARRDRSAGRRRPAASASSPIDEQERVTGFQEKPRRPARSRARRISRSPRWASTSSRPTCSCSALEADADAADEPTISARTSFRR